MKIIGHMIGDKMPKLDGKTYGYDKKGMSAYKKALKKISKKKKKKNMGYGDGMNTETPNGLE